MKVEYIPHRAYAVEEDIALPRAVQPRDFAQNYGEGCGFLHSPCDESAKATAYAIIGTAMQAIIADVGILGRRILRQFIR